MRSNIVSPKDLPWLDLQKEAVVITPRLEECGQTHACSLSISSSIERR
jgi:hypothetical protein